MGDLIVRDKPILFSAPMVRALLAGRKTQTRRLPKAELAQQFDKTGDKLLALHPRQHGAGWEIGDRLWVREACCIVDNREFGGERYVEYRADTSASHPAGWENAPDDPQALKWRPSIHMPRWASRLTLTVTDVRVQRLQDISEEDAKAEGIYWSEQFEGWTSGRCEDESGDFHQRLAVVSFSKLWDGIHGDGTWDTNPWIVALTFAVTTIAKEGE